MLFFKLQINRIAQMLEQLQGIFMNQSGFAMHERHVQETALFRAELFVQIQANCLLSQSQSQGVLGKGLRRVTKQIAGKLIQHNNFSQSACYTFAPAPEFATSCLLMDTHELLCNMLIKFQTFAKPEGLMVGVEPKV